MNRTKFKEIAEKENGKFYYKDENAASLNGVRYPYVLFLLQIDYKNHKIIIDNRTGTSFVGTATLILDTTTKSVDFEVSSISHFKNLFLRKKSRFNISSNNQNIKYFIKNNIAFNKLNNIGKKTAFNPDIKVNLAERPNKIITKYHLEFEDWTQVIEPLIEFYKNLADEFDKNIFSLSSAQYKELK